MNNFFKTFFAALLAFIAGNIILVVLAVMMITGIGMALMGKPAMAVKPSSVLLIDLAQPIGDDPSANPLSALDIVSLNISQELALRDVIDAIDRAATDTNIKGIYFNPSPYSGLPMATVEEIRGALLRFRESGKFVVSYADSYPQSMYYLATAADKVYVAGEGTLEWVGLASGVMFYKGLLDKLGIETEVIRHGDYKSAVEPFIMDKMSPENRQQMDVLLGTIWGNMVRNVAVQRGVDSSALQAYASGLSVVDPRDAVEKGMIDGMVYPDFVEAALSLMVKGDSVSANTAAAQDTASGSDAIKVDKISLADYIAAGGAATGHVSKNRIAVVYAEGQIIDGNKPQKGYVVGNVLAGKLRDLRANKDVKAVVLRVNSPGGSALASEIIWKEMSLLRAEKPVVVSMGNTAASGGYYIAAPADAILASPSTVTGSIGVFGLMLNARQGLKDKLGLTVDIAKTNASADLGASVFGLGVRSLSELEKAKMQQNVDKIYTTFVTHVADGRNLSYEAVDKIAGGRVWSGMSALELGLIDGFGGLKEAVGLAADRAGVAGDYRVSVSSVPMDNIEMLIMQFLSSGTQLYKGQLGEAYSEYEHLRDILSTQGVQAVMPYVPEIR